MAEYRTIARPYARAVFELAVEQNSLPAWSNMLAVLAVVAQQPQVVKFLLDPSVTPEQVIALFCDVCGDVLDELGQRFVEILCKEQRLVALPDIQALFEHLRKQHEQKIEAKVFSAEAISEQQQQELVAALKKRFACDVSLTCQIDKSLIGGAVIRAGDLVIDGSVKSKLKAMREAVV